MIEALVLREEEDSIKGHIMEISDLLHGKEIEVQFCKLVLSDCEPLFRSWNHTCKNPGPVSVSNGRQQLSRDSISTLW